jgi:hypothetical protein
MYRHNAAFAFSKIQNCVYTNVKFYYAVVFSDLNREKVNCAGLSHRCTSPKVAVCCAAEYSSAPWKVNKHNIHQVP